MKTPLRISLNSDKFPFLYRDAQRTVVLPGLDANVRAQAYFGDMANADWGIPTLLYCENVMPIARGLISTEITNAIEKFAVGNTEFDQAIVVRDSLENNTLVVPARGKNYVLMISTGTWVSSLAFTPSHLLVTRAYVQGRSFICYEKEKIFEYDGGTGLLVDVTSSIVFPAGYSIADVRGIGSASNYLLLFLDIQIHWSSPSDPLNFDRATNNGSGYQIPQDVRGRISCILPVSGGAIIYTVRNAVAITYTNNASVPFVFRGISNSGGVASYEQVAYDADERFQYAYGSGGLQRVSLQVAEAAFPEVTDFLTSALYESFNYSTKKVETIQLGSYLSVKLTYVSQRFLVISYGQTANTYTYALIFDTALQRWGKVKTNHVDAFTYPYPNILGDLTYAQLLTDISGLGDISIADLGVGILSISPPKKSIAFLQADGTINLLAVDYRASSSVGVAVIGHIQHNRNRLTTLHKVELEGLDDSSVAPLVYDLISLNGKTIEEVRQYQPYFEDIGYKEYLGDAVGKNHQLAVIASMALTSCVVEVANHGRSV